jgi:hypothetical protein
MNEVLSDAAAWKHRVEDHRTLGFSVSTIKADLAPFNLSLHTVWRRAQYIFLWKTGIYRATLT